MCGAGTGACAINGQKRLWKTLRAFSTLRMPDPTLIRKVDVAFYIHRRAADKVKGPDARAAGPFDLACNLSLAY
jgi:hypothetical protein